MRHSRACARFYYVRTRECARNSGVEANVYPPSTLSALSFHSWSRQGRGEVGALPLREAPEQHEPEETRQADQSRPKTHRIEGRETVVKKVLKERQRS